MEVEWRGGCEVRVGATIAFFLRDCLANIYRDPLQNCWTASTSSKCDGSGIGSPSSRIEERCISIAFAILALVRGINGNATCLRPHPEFLAAAMREGFSSPVNMVPRVFDGGFTVWPGRCRL